MVGNPFVWHVHVPSTAERTGARIPARAGSPHRRNRGCRSDDLRGRCYPAARLAVVPLLRNTLPAIRPPLLLRTTRYPMPLELTHPEAPPHPAAASLMPAIGGFPVSDR